MGNSKLFPDFIFESSWEVCNKVGGIYISRAAYSALRFLNNTPMDKVYRLNLNKEVKKQMEKVTTFMISNNYSKKPKSLEMLSYIKEWFVYGNNIRKGG